MVRKTSGFAAALLGVVLAGARIAPAYATQGWVPQLESIGRTTLLYAYLSRGLAFAVGTLAVFALGYWAGTRLELATACRSVAPAIGVGGAVGYVVGTLLLLGGLGGMERADTGVVDGVGIGVGILLAQLIAQGVRFAIVGFAGAALASLADDRAAPGEGNAPAANGAEGPASTD